MIKKELKYLIGFALIFGGVSGVFAQNFSPFSPAFILKSGDIQSSSSVGFNWFNGQSSSPSQSSSLKISTASASQSVFVGLPYDIQIGAALAYSDWVSKSPQSLNVVSGFSNPNFSARKVWFGDTDTRVNLALGVTPNTDSSGSRGSPSIYSAGLSGVFIVSPDFVGALGVSRLVSDNDGAWQVPDSTGINGTISKTIASYLVNIGVTATRFDSQLVNSGYRQPSYGYSGNMQVSREISKNIWGGLLYGISTNNTSANLNGDQFNNKNLNNTLIATLNLVF